MKQPSGTKSIALRQENSLLMINKIVSKILQKNGKVSEQIQRRLKWFGTKKIKFDLVKSVRY
ncbi:hypothetical protein EO95_17120 [Methanosarcina sp. 1.H.T.1A.1]|nr:hypothetical protein EO95_17120 [Methanosarcina sp. 1.H.T.1A.1]